MVRWWVLGGEKGSKGIVKGQRKGRNEDVWGRKGGSGECVGKKEKG